jgi:phosphonate transport system permease protein
VRASAVLGLIGAGGIGDMLSSYMRYRQWSVIRVLLIDVLRARIATHPAVRERFADIIAENLNE